MHRTRNLPACMAGPLVRRRSHALRPVPLALARRPPRVPLCGQGVGWAFDFMQQRAPEGEDAGGGKRMRGYGVNVTYDWEALGAAFGLELDYVARSEALYVGLNAFSGEAGAGAGRRAWRSGGGGGGGWGRAPPVHTCLCVLCFGSGSLARACTASQASSLGATWPGRSWPPPPPGPRAFSWWHPPGCLRTGGAFRTGMRLCVRAFMFMRTA